MAKRFRNYASRVCCTALVTSAARATGNLGGGQKYTKISPPILAIFAVPPDFGALLGDTPSSVRAAFEAKEGAHVEAQVKSFETGPRRARSSIAPCGPLRFSI